MAGKTVIQGTTGYIAWTMPFQLAEKKEIIIQFVNYTNSSSVRIPFPTVFDTTPILDANSTSLTFQPTTSLSWSIVNNIPVAATNNVADPNGNYNKSYITIPPTQYPYSQSDIIVSALVPENGYVILGGL